MKSKKTHNFTSADRAKRGSSNLRIYEETKLLRKRDRSNCENAIKVIARSKELQKCDCVKKLQKCKKKKKIGEILWAESKFPNSNPANGPKSLERHQYILEQVSYIYYVSSRSRE